MLKKHHTRRAFLKATAGLLLAGLPPTACATATKTTRVYIGTTSRRDGGIYALTLDLESGALINNGPVATPGSSYLALHPNKNWLYAVAGNRQSQLYAYAIDPENHALEQINNQPTHGAGGCHISLDQTGQWALVANYSSGNLAVFPLGENGQLGEASSVVQHAGRRPRAHMVITSPDNRFALAADLGLDKIMIHAFDGEKGILTPHSTPWTETAAGAGPRHLAFHPSGRHVFVINEHDSTLSAYRYERGELTAPHTLSTLPEDFVGRNYCAAIRVSADGRFVYGSNRGHDSIATFSFDADKNQLEPSGHIASGGSNPRDIQLDPSGAFLLAAHEGSGHVTSFHIERKTGHLTPSGHALELPQPMCIAFARS